MLTSTLHCAQSHGIRIAPVITVVHAAPVNMLCFDCSRCVALLGVCKCQSNHVDASAHICWDAAGVVPLLLNVLTAASQELEDSCVLSACQHILLGFMARRACQCLALLSAQDVSRVEQP